MKGLTRRNLLTSSAAAGIYTLTPASIRTAKAASNKANTPWYNWSGAQSCNPAGRFSPNTEAELFIGNSGTTVRFLTALLSIAGGKYFIDGVPRMRERPISDLVSALHQLGCEVRQLDCFR